MGLFSRSHHDDERWVIVGLGNPGEKYAETRHNAGVLVVEELLGRTGGKLKSHKSGCMIAEGNLAGQRATLARPTSYMNESGRPVRALATFYKTPLDHLVVVHDEIDIPFGEVRIKVGGGAAGHNGIKSVASHLGKDFVRVRVGVGRPRSETVDHVLSRFSGAERKELPHLLGAAADAVEQIVADGLERAMNHVNTRS